MLSHELKARVLQGARATPAPDRMAMRRIETLAVAAATAIAVGLFVALGGLRAAPRPELLIAGTSLGAVLVALAAAWTALGRGGSMLGRPRAVLAATTIAAPAVLFAWKVLFSTRFAGMTDPWPDRPGLKCLALSLAVGVWPLAACVLLRRGSDPLHPTLSGAALGVTAGALSWTLVDLWCPVAYVPHLLLGHLLPLLMLTGIGAALGARVLAVRATGI